MDLGRLEFRYSMPPENQHVAVGVNSNYYTTTTLSFLQLLCKKLKEAIPFKYEIVSKPEVRILGGDRARGMASVEMMIQFEISDTDALSQLKSKNFAEGFEPTH